MKRTITKVQYRRRASRVTDYNSRRYILAGNVPRLVVRKSNRYILIQIVKSESAQDKVVSNTLSRELSKYGFAEEYSMKNLAAAYLTGFLAASKSMKEVKKAVLDLGMLKSTKGNRIYAALKGAVDAGLEIPHSEEMLPSMEEIKDKTENDVEKIKSKIKESFK